ncbi:MAG: C4-dicarboxylate ABC transporter, partial [Rhodocyclaceae bacterium]|nr:C4-dicarboxylate ABC transporter [Rhodocyclaceae bacterium]
MKKELRFGFALMAMILLTTAVFMPWGNLTNGHLGLLMLSLVVVAIMLGFPTAFTLMGMGVFFAWLNYRGVNPDIAVRQTLDLMVQRAYGVMSNDVLISIPLFVFMGYLVERANLIEKLFRSIHLALARIPGSLAVATLITCAIFATATGIVGAVVTLMGLLAFPAMLRHGYDIKLSAGSITAGGCLGILIPPSVLLIVYGATAGVSVVQLYAGAFFPGLMLAGLYVGYVIIMAKWKPHLAPPLSAEDRIVPLPPHNRAIAESIGRKALPALLAALKGRINVTVPTGAILKQLIIVLLPAFVWFGAMGLIYSAVTVPPEQVDTSGLQEMGAASGSGSSEEADDSAREPKAEGVSEPEEETDGVKEPPTEAAKTPAAEKPVSVAKAEAPAAPAVDAERQPAPMSFWITLAAGTLAVVFFYWIFDFTRLEIFKMLLASFFPLAILILAVLGSIVFG